MPSDPLKPREDHELSKRSRFGYLKAVLFFILLDLVIEFILGMYLNLFGIRSQISGGGGMEGMMSAMMSAGAMSVLMPHMLNGFVLGIMSLVVLGLSLLTKTARLVILSLVGIAFTLFAGISGLSFMFSMFSDNFLSFAMALGFLGAFISYFFEIYFAR